MRSFHSPGMVHIREAIRIAIKSIDTINAANTDASNHLCYDEG